MSARNAFSANTNDGYNKNDLTVGEIKVNDKTAATVGDNITNEITLNTASNATSVQVIDNTVNHEIVIKTLPVTVTYAIESPSYTEVVVPSVEDDADGAGNDGIKVSSSILTQGQGGILVITFEDAVGIKTVKNIKFVK